MKHFHKETKTMTKFNINSKDLGTLKSAARYMKLDWMSLAARPAVANRILGLIKELGLEKGCEEYGSNWAVAVTQSDRFGS